MSSKSSPFAEFAEAAASTTETKSNASINLYGLTVKELCDTLTRILTEHPEVASYPIVGAQGSALTSYVNIDIEHKEERCVIET